MTWKDGVKFYGQDAFDHLLTLKFDNVIDIGSGDGHHTTKFREAGKNVTAISLRQPADLIGDYLNMVFWEVECIWACHVLEHQPNPNLFLAKCFDDLEDGGILAITVPPLKHSIVGGHLTLWNMGLLLYNLILAGFDCSDAWYKSYGYNISVIVRKKPANLPKLDFDSGDIDKLARFFPFPVHEGFDGNI